MRAEKPIVRTRRQMNWAKDEMWGPMPSPNLQTLGRSASAIFRKSIPVAKLGLRYAARHLDIEEVA